MGDASSPGPRHNLLEQGMSLTDCLWIQGEFDPDQRHPAVRERAEYVTGDGLHVAEQADLSGLCHRRAGQRNGSARGSVSTEANPRKG